MKEFGKVSVIMPAFNCEHFIAEAIESVQKQTYQNWELLIVDDASEDGTRKVAENYLSEERISIFYNSTNSGTQHSRNKAIQEASGDFIAFLDADDAWKPEKLQKQLYFMQENQLAACFSSYELMDENGIPSNKKIEALPVLTYEKLLKANYVGNLTGVYSVEKLGKIFAPNIQKRQDWALWLEVIQKGGKMESIAESLAYYRIRKNSISGNKLEMLKYNYQVYNKVLGYSTPKSLIKMLIFLKEQLFIKSKQHKKSDF